MPIKDILVICLPCPKCEALELKIREQIKSIEMVNRIKIVFEYKRITDLRELSKYSLNASQTPAVLINGVVEFAGRVEPIVMRRRLEEIHKTG